LECKLCSWLKIAHIVRLHCHIYESTEMKLTKKSRRILEAISKGHTYDQILIKKPKWTYNDIFESVSEVLSFVGPESDQKSYSLESIHHDHPNAYQKWDAKMDEQLVKLFRSGKSVNQIARIMGRQNGGIQSRLRKLHLVDD